MANGTRTTNIDTRVALSDEVMVNKDGTTALQKTTDLATQVFGSEIYLQSAAKVAQLENETSLISDKVDTLDTNLNARVDALQATQTTNQIIELSWADLAARTPDVIGQGAEITVSATGTHEDPLSTESVPDAGQYRGYALAAGAWARIGDAVYSDKLSASDIGTAAYAATEDFAKSDTIGTPSELSVSEYALAVEFDDGKTYAPVMDTSGRTLTTDESGRVRRVQGQGEALFDLGPTFFHERSPVTQIVVDPDGYITELWTKDGRYYIEGLSGLVRESAGDALNDTSLAWAYSGIIDVYGNDAALSFETGRDILCGFIDTGQSNAIGQNQSNDAVIASDPIYMGHALMFSSDIGPWRTVEASVTTAVDMVEADRGAQSETAMSGWLNHFIRDFEAFTGVQPYCMGWVAGNGGQPWRDRMPGTDGTGGGAIFSQSLKDFVTIAEGMDREPVVYAVAISAGEAESGDANVNRERYLRQLQREVRWKREEILRITGQKIEPVFLVSQTHTPAGPSHFSQPVKEAQLMSDGLENMRLASPFYQWPTATLDGANSNIHGNCVGQNHRGQALARATIREIFSLGHTPLKPTGEYVWNSATEFDVRFHAPCAPLVLDTSGDLIDLTDIAGTLGFVFDDNSGAPPTISSITVQDSVWLRFTLSEAPAGLTKRLSYAMDGTSGEYGPLYGARGCLRDSTTHINLYDATAQHEWCCAFNITVQ